MKICNMSGGKLNSLSIGVINRRISNQMGSFPGEVTLARGKEIV